LDTSAILADIGAHWHVYLTIDAQASIAKPLVALTMGGKPSPTSPKR
jgi:hypothetical protein